MPIRRLSRSMVKAVATAAETAGHCNTTIAARLPILFGCSLAASGEAMAEWNLAYSEKVEATWEGAFAAAAEMQASLFRSAFRVPTPFGFAEDMARVIDKAGHPARRKVKANAKRLSAPRKA